MTWLNWSLKLHSELRTISHLIHTHNTQDFCSMNAYFICVIVHVQMWYVYSIACRSNPKIFLSILFVFESVFYAFVFWVFVQIAFFIFFIKNSFNHKKLATKLFPWKWVKVKYENTKFRQKLSWLSCYCFASKVFPRKVLCFRGVFHE